MSAPAEAVPVAPLARWWVPVFVLFTIHNLEEIFSDLPAWGRAHAMSIPTTELDISGYAGLIVVMSMVFFVAAYVIRRNARLTRLGLLAFTGIMCGNFIMHFGVSLITSSLQPGVITAGLLTPVYIGIFLNVLKQREPE